MMIETYNTERVFSKFRFYFQELHLRERVTNSLLIGSISDYNIGYLTDVFDVRLTKKNNLKE